MRHEHRIGYALVFACPYRVRAQGGAMSTSSRQEQRSRELAAHGLDFGQLDVDRGRTMVTI